MVFLLFQSFHSHVWRPAVIPLAFDRRRYQEPPLLPLMVIVLGPEVLEQKVLGPKVLETTNDVVDPPGGTKFVCGVCAIGQGRSVSVAVSCMSGVARSNSLLSSFPQQLPIAPTNDLMASNTAASKGTPHGCEE